VRGPLRQLLKLALRGLQARALGAPPRHPGVEGGLAHADVRCRGLERSAALNREDDLIGDVL
jgi:hypothetical protein